MNAFIRNRRERRQRRRHGHAFRGDRSLDCVRAGERFEVAEVGDAGARVNALRFGMAEGACLECVTRIPAGPIVVRVGRQEIAIGR